MNRQKAAIIGCGFVGSSTAFALMQKGLFSELVLIDADQKKAHGEAADIAHGRPFAHMMQIYAGDYSDVGDCGLIIITAGAAQKPGESRTALVYKNVEIFKNIIPQITAQNFEGILLIVSNPVDILTYAAWKISGYPKERVIGSGTVLDSARFRYLLSGANVSGIPIHDFCEIRGHYDHEQAMEQIYRRVRESAYQIIEEKGATYYGVAMAVTRIVVALIRDEGAVLPISSLMQGEYGLSDLCISVPAIVGGNGVQQVLEIPLNEKEHTELLHSANKLKEILQKIWL